MLLSNQIFKNELHSPDRTAFALQAHILPSGEWNYYTQFPIATVKCMGVNDARLKSHIWKCHHHSQLVIKNTIKTIKIRLSSIKGSTLIPVH